MEEKLREVSGNPMFRIVCSPVDETAKGLGITSDHYYKNEYFAIFYHPKTDEKQLRIMLAHELGHLFLVELINSQFNEQLNAETMIEPASTMFGIFTIFHKNEFYHNKMVPYKHSSPEEILSDFLHLIKNRSANKFNTSE
jgi:hypothetical protein